MSLLKTLRPVVIAAALAATGLAVLAADPTGTVQGNAAPGEQIVLISDADGSVRGAVCDAAGRFEFKNLRVGQYEVIRNAAPDQKHGAPVMAGRVTTVKL